MIQWIAGLLVAFGLVLSGPTQAQDNSSAIQDVISQQFGSFAQDDWAGAFQFASPMIQQMFKTPDNFGTMVRRGYPMVWRPSERSFGALETRGTRKVQEVFLRDQEGRSFIAEYDMIMVDGIWRINGVSIRRNEELGA